MPKTGEAYIRSSEQRTLDIVGSSLLGLTSLPFLGAAALALRKDTKGSSVFFKQLRLGLDEEQFEVIKLRTLKSQTHTGVNEIGGPDHPDASKTGKVIRKLGIDELPQTINVLRGNIHLFGISL